MVNAPILHMFNSKNKQTCCTLVSCYVTLHIICTPCVVWIRKVPDSSIWWQKENVPQDHVQLTVKYLYTPKTWPYVESELFFSRPCLFRGDSRSSNYHVPGSENVSGICVSMFLRIFFCPTCQTCSCWKLFGFRFWGNWKVTTPRHNLNVCDRYFTFLYPRVLMIASTD